MPKDSAAKQLGDRLANGQRALTKATSIGPHPTPSFLDHLLNLATGYPLPGELATKGDVAAAGVPFLPGARVFRGATSMEKLMAPNAEHLLNFAEDAAHSSRFAAGPEGNALGGVMMPAELKIQNALDLTPEGLGSLHGADGAMTAGDLKKVEPFIPPDQLAQFKKSRAYWRGNDPDARYEGRQNILSLIEQLMRQNPTTLQQAGFDGLRYIDGATPAWAAVSPEQVVPKIGKH